MKKILRGVLLGILALIIIGGAAVAVFLFGGKKPDLAPQPYVVDGDGMSYLAVVDEDGVTYAAVTDAVGNIYAAEVDESGNIGETKGQINDQVDISKLPTNYTGEHIADTADADAFTGTFDIVEEPATQAAETPASPSDDNGSSNAEQPSAQKPGDDTTPTGEKVPTKNTGDNSGSTQAASQSATQAAKQHYRVEKYQEMFKSGQYLMTFKTSDEELGNAPLTFATKNGSFLMGSKLENMSFKMLYRANEDKTYIMIDDLKKYSEMPEEMMGEESLDLKTLTSEMFKEIPLDNVKVSTVKMGNKTLNCETVEASDGTKTRYFFDGDTLVRIDTINADGTSDSSIYISQLTSDVPDSTFEIPKNYSYLNLSWLAKTMGEQQ